MALSTDVNLPRTHTPRFPTTCVRCQEDAGSETIRTAGFTVSWFTTFFWLFASKFVAQVPACPECRFRLRFQRFGSLLVTIFIVAVVAIFIWPHVTDFVAPSARRWAMLGLALVCLSPWWMFEIFFPSAFDVTVYRNSVDYEFANEDYAHQFALLNDDADWVKIDGEEV